MYLLLLNVEPKICVQVVENSAKNLVYRKSLRVETTLATVFQDGIPSRFTPVEGCGYFNRRVPIAMGGKSL